MPLDKETANEALRHVLQKSDYCRIVTLVIFASFVFWMYLDWTRQQRDSEYLREILVRQEIAAKAALEQTRINSEMLQILTRILVRVEDVEAGRTNNRAGVKPGDTPS